MIILPAIDIIGGKPVRLYQGSYDTSEQVAADVLETAKAFADQGAQWLHMVDLDGAKSGHPVNQDLIVQAARESGLHTEVGGGIRTMSDIESYLDRGIDRIILGTSALQNPELVKEAVFRYGDKIAVGIDAKDGEVMVEGWVDGGGANFLDFALKMQELGVKTIIFTDISRDGTLGGPNLRMLRELAGALNLQIIASGGIHNLEDIQDLAQLDLYGAITGKAMYAGTLDLKEAIEAGNPTGLKSCEKGAGAC